MKKLLLVGALALAAAFAARGAEEWYHRLTDRVSTSLPAELSGASFAGTSDLLGWYFEYNKWWDGKRKVTITYKIGDPNSLSDRSTKFTWNWGFPSDDKRLSGACILSFKHNGETVLSRVFYDANMPRSGPLLAESCDVFCAYEDTLTWEYEMTDPGYPLHGAYFYFGNLKSAPTTVVTVKLDQQGGTGGPNTLQVAYDRGLPDLPSLPSKPGVRFLGYFDDPRHGTKYYDGNGIKKLETCKLKEPTTLYAHWRERLEELLPPGYTKVDAIRSTGEQYIDTGYSPGYLKQSAIDCVVSVATEQPKGWAAIFGAEYGDRSFTFYAKDENNFARYIRGPMSDATVVFPRETKVRVKCWECDAYINPPGARLNSEYFTPYSLDPTFYIFDKNKNLYYKKDPPVNGCAMTLYSFVIEERDADGRLEWYNRDFVPCIAPDGEVGLYDLETLKFFGNQGTGKFEHVVDFTTPYLDWNGTELVPSVTNAIAISSATTVLCGDHWYVVTGNVETVDLTVKGRAHLILADGATLTAKASGSGHSGLDVSAGSELFIYGQQLGTGQLAAIGGHVDGAGIGSSASGSSCGSVTINGGQITAIGGSDAAGIGGSYNGQGGIVTINAGTVRARCSAAGAAGIGGGRHASAGIITINGGWVLAEGSAAIGVADWCSSGIGGGADSKGGSVTINGGTVTAIGADTSDDIGNGGGGTGCSVRICGGNVFCRRGRVPQPTNAKDENVYCLTVRGWTGFERLERLDGLEGYGLNDVQALDGNLYLWLPSGRQELRVNGVRYVATITTCATEAISSGTTLEAAFDAAQTQTIVRPVFSEGVESGWLVTLGADYMSGVSLPTDIGPVTIDLNGHAIMGTNGVDGVASGPGGNGGAAIALAGESGLQAGATALTVGYVAKPDDATGTPLGVASAIGDVMVVDLTRDEGGHFPVSYYRGVDMGTFNCDVYKTGKIVLRRIPAGEAYPVEAGAKSYPITKTLVPRQDFYVGLFEITGAQYDRVMDEESLSEDMAPKRYASHSTFRSAKGATQLDPPAEDKFIGIILANAVDASGEPVEGFDLPTANQWEIAARAGATGQYGAYLDTNGTLVEGTAENVPEFAQTGSGNPVGSLRPNAWGFYDMCGGVGEWCRNSGKDVETAVKGTYWPFRGNDVTSWGIEHILSDYAGWTGYSGVNCGARLSCAAHGQGPALGGVYGGDGGDGNPPGKGAPSVADADGKAVDVNDPFGVCADGVDGGLLVRLPDMPGRSFVVTNEVWGWEIPSQDGLTFALPMGAPIAVYAVAKTGYVLDRAEPYVIEAVTPDLLIDPDRLPTVRPIRYTVTYRPGDGAGEDYVQECTYDVETLAVSGDDVSMALLHHKIVGWEDDAGARYACGAPLLNLSAVDGGNVDLRAVWDVSEFPVTVGALPEHVSVGVTVEGRPIPKFDEGWYVADGKTGVVTFVAHDGYVFDVVPVSDTYSVSVAVAGMSPEPVPCPGLVPLGDERNPWAVGPAGHESDVTAYVSDAGELVIGGSGVVASTPWTSSASGIMKLRVAEGVTDLGETTKTLPNLTSVNGLAVGAFNSAALGAVKAAGFSAIAVDPASREAELTVVVSRTDSLAEPVEWTPVATNVVPVKAEGSAGFFIVAPAEK